MRGVVVLIEGPAAGRDATGLGTLAAWSAVPAHSVLGVPADVIHLPPGTSPQTARGYLERAAVEPGPVLIYVAGHALQGKRGGIHVGLTSTNPTRVRWDGLPWSWLVPLGGRGPGRTLVMADLTADDPTLPLVAEIPGVPLWGVLAAPGPDRQARRWTRTVLAGLRDGWPTLPRTLDPCHVDDVTGWAPTWTPGSALRLTNPAGWSVPTWPTPATAR